MAVLEKAQLDEAVAGLDGWEVRDGALEKAYDRGDFDGSMAFVQGIAEAANAADHHPDIAVSWGTVTLRWVSHSAGGITADDVRMARKSDQLAG
ncbi:MAG TPA: 4a-hydroxytetrahydrobiopterin dehydratase [Gaiellales bacterium]|jgi:4a-hydroxytetrahydrobiopterin dehydratase|nr:4a-hydroxytetrahydrobiopterin dehydratase [Gaiellales bacterium]